jgi:hypothetical protein
MSPTPQHDEVETFENDESASNPEAQDFSISVSIPENIEIDMVDARSLDDYEIWGVVTSVMLSLFSGFLIACVQETETRAFKIFVIITVILGLLLLGSIALALIKRKFLKSKGRKFFLKTTRVTETRRQTR